MILEEQLVVSAAPHIRDRRSTSSIMLDVIIALMPAAIAAAYFYGFRAVMMMLVGMAACIAFEALWQKLCHKPLTVRDGSAAVTGLLLAMNLPATMPYWMVVIGSLFAIIIVKQLFGGLGKNFVNPALAARGFLLASWIVPMTTWVAPRTALSVFGSNVDAVTQATPLAILKGAEGVLPGWQDMLIGNVGGCLGETSALAILIGGLYLVCRRVISLKIPVTYILTVGILTYILGGSGGFFTGDAISNMLSGGLFLGAFFMATDYTTSPVTPWGQYIMGIGCGALTAIIRIYGSYPEGVTYAILLMNIVTPLIDKCTVPRVFGTGGKRA